MDIRSLDNGVSTNRERPHAAKLHRDAVKTEPARGQLIQVAKMLDYRNACPEQQRVRGPRAVLRVVNVHRIYADQRRRGFYQQLGGASGHERSALAVLGRSPICVPAGANQNCPVSQVQALKKSFTNRAAISHGNVYHQPLDISQTFEWQRAEINSVFETMERRVNVGTGVADQFNATDLKRRSLGVPAARRLAAQVIGDDRGGKTGICDHSRFDLMAYIN